MTQLDELHRETKITPVKNHNLLLQQFLLQSYKIEHPNNTMRQKQEPARTLKPTLKMCFDKQVQELDNLEDRWYKRGRVLQAPEKLPQQNQRPHYDACPDCGSSPHNTEQLFKCPRKPTTLDVRLLWDSLQTGI